MQYFLFYFGVTNLFQILTSCPHVSSTPVTICPTLMSCSLVSVLHSLCTNLYLSPVVSIPAVSCCLTSFWVSWPQPGVFWYVSPGCLFTEPFPAVKTLIWGTRSCLESCIWIFSMCCQLIVKPLCWPSTCYTCIFVTALISELSYLCYDQTKHWCSCDHVYRNMNDQVKALLNHNQNQDSHVHVN